MSICCVSSTQWTLSSAHVSCHTPWSLGRGVIGRHGSAHAGGLTVGSENYTRPLFNNKNRRHPICLGMGRPLLSPFDRWGNLESQLEVTRGLKRMRRIQAQVCLISKPRGLAAPWSSPLSPVSGRPEESKEARNPDYFLAPGAAPSCPFAECR